MSRLAPAIAGALVLMVAPAFGSGLAATPPAGGGAVPSVVPGDHIAIACAALDRSTSASDIRVVMRLAPEAGENATGFNAVLATDEERMDGSVRIRVPKIPSLAHHTVRLQVYVVGDKGAQSCDAGLVKIV